MTFRTISKNKPYLAGLDGLRAISVLGVMIYHLDISWLFPGGFLGVDVFFTLSGFLITSLIIREIRTNGRLSLRRFYARRMMRLFPVVVAMLIATWLACFLFARDALPLFKQDFPAAALYASNWWQIYSEQSYFEQSGRPRLLLHLWSLSIEEQFYIVWPMFLMFFLGRWGRVVVATFTAFFAVTVTVWMGMLSVQNGYPLDADPSRAYLGTDTHTMGLFVGALLAMLWSPWDKLVEIQVGPSRQRALILDLAGYVMIAALLVIMMIFKETDEQLYQGGFLVVALLTAGLVYVAGNENLSVVKLLGTKWLRWFGKRSYGLYIWHWPIFSLLRPGFELPEGSLKASLMRLLITFAIAEISYRYIEQPFRYNGGKLYAGFTKFIAVTALVLIGIICTIQFSGIIQNSNVSLGAVANERVSSAEVGPIGDLKVDVSTSGSSKLSFANTCDFENSGETSHEKELTLIGDSVLLGAQDYITRHIAKVYVDGKVGRQGSEGLSVIKGLGQAGHLGNTVLLHLGTNGYLAEKHLRSILHELEGRKVILVNTHAPRRWVDVNNDLITQLHTEFSGFSILDWSAISAGHDEYFVHDGIHLTGKGIQKYSEAISSALQVPFYSDNCAPKVFAANQLVQRRSARNADSDVGSGVVAATPLVLDNLTKPVEIEKDRAAILTPETVQGKAAVDGLSAEGG